MSWIKYEHTTSDKPEVWEIARRLGIDPDAVVGKLLRIWIWFDQHTVDGHAPSVTSALLNRYVCRDDFVQTVADVGWLTVTDDFVSIPKFDIHNGESAKQRAVNQRRQQKHRKNTGNQKSVTQVSQDCHDTSVTTVMNQTRQSCDQIREEKIRIEDIPIGDPPKEKRKRFTPPTLEEVRAFCQSNGLAWSPQRFIDHYAAGGWKLSGGRPMADWQAAARNWKDYGATPYQPPPKPEPPRKMITPIPRNV